MADENINVLTILSLLPNLIRSVLVFDSKGSARSELLFRVARLALVDPCTSKHAMLAVHGAAPVSYPLRGHISARFSERM
jgi:hypothetical protein